MCGIFGKCKLVLTGHVRLRMGWSIRGQPPISVVIGIRYSMVPGYRQWSMALRSGREASSGYIVYPYLSRLF